MFFEMKCCQNYASFTLKPSVSAISGVWLHFVVWLMFPEKSLLSVQPCRTQPRIKQANTMGTVCGRKFVLNFCDFFSLKLVYMTSFFIQLDKHSLFLRGKLLHFASIFYFEKVLLLHTSVSLC